MRFGYVVPYADAREFAELAAIGEQHGWDGVFTWEAVWGVHAWVALGAAAMVTERIRLGTLLTPASRWRPWDLASAVATVDRLSGGRAIMSVGLGAVHEGWTAFEPDEGRRARAQKLDECLAIFDGLMRGQPFSYRGQHYSAEPTDHLVPDPPVQRPRPPVWVVGVRIIANGSQGDRDSTSGAGATGGAGGTGGADGKRGKVGESGTDDTSGGGRATVSGQASLRRAARWDGLLPAVHEDGTHRDLRNPAELADIVAEVRGMRVAAGLADDPFDVVIEGDSTGEFVRLDPQDPAAWEAAGATWWVESWWTIQPGSAGIAEVRRRIEAGPPR